jgi:hypothetical protein
MYSRSRLTRYWAYTSPPSQFWSCEIAKWNGQLSHLPAPQHEWLAVSLLPRHKHWDYHRITGGLQKKRIFNADSRVPCQHIHKTRYAQNVSHEYMEILSHQNHVHKNGINSAVSSAQNVGIDHNDVLLSVSFLSRLNFRVAVGITKASGTPVVYKAFYRLVWRANIFGLAKEREDCSACLSGSESSHVKQFTLRRVLSPVFCHTLDNAVEHNIIE